MPNSLDLRVYSSREKKIAVSSTVCQLLYLCNEKHTKWVSQNKSPLFAKVNYLTQCNLSTRKIYLTSVKVHPRLALFSVLFFFSKYSHKMKFTILARFQQTHHRINRTTFIHWKLEGQILIIQSSVRLWLPVLTRMCVSHVLLAEG